MTLEENRQLWFIAERMAKRIYHGDEHQIRHALIREFVNGYMLLPPHHFASAPEDQLQEHTDPPSIRD